jgi:ketosteroid isomerase-like protein
MTPEQVAFQFVDAINARQVDKLAEWMTAEHRFIDSDGVAYSGKARIRQGWDYFRMVPDYRIEVLETYSRDDVVVLGRSGRGNI